MMTQAATNVFTRFHVRHLDFIDEMIIMSVVFGTDHAFIELMAKTKMRSRFLRNNCVINPLPVNAGLFRPIISIDRTAIGLSIETVCAIRKGFAMTKTWSVFECTLPLAVFTSIIIPYKEGFTAAYCIFLLPAVIPSASCAFRKVFSFT